MVACDMDGNGGDRDTLHADVLCGDLATDESSSDEGPSDEGQKDVPAAGDCQTPDTLEDPCHAAAACTDGMHCFAPGDQNCGICMEVDNPCETDDECVDAAPVCDYDPAATCVCSPAKTCIPRCDAESGTACDEESQVCDQETGHCKVRPCTSDADCPATFACTSGEGGLACTRKTCTTNPDCGNCLWCVNGGCQVQPGTCSYYAP
jgi:hypothetical protein